MTSKELKFISLKNKEDNFSLISDPRGVMILAFIANSGKDEGVVDSYSVGMKFSSIKKLLYCVNHNQKFINNDLSLMVWKDKESIIHLDFSADGIKNSISISSNDGKRFLENLEIIYQDYSKLN